MFKATYLNYKLQSGATYLWKSGTTSLMEKWSQRVKLKLIPQSNEIKSGWAVEISVAEWVEHWLSKGKVQGSNLSAANAETVMGRLTHLWLIQSLATA